MDCLIHAWVLMGPATGAYRKGNEPDDYYFFFDGTLELCANCPASRIVFFDNGLSPVELDGPINQLSISNHAANAALK